jgi:hypothetical protein
MTCIDAAIIKALVSHIGMNPDDVPIGGAGSGSSGIYTGTEVKDLPFDFTTKPIRINKKDFTIPYKDLCFGTKLILENTDNGTKFNFSLIERLVAAQVDGEFLPQCIFAAGTTFAEFTYNSIGEHAGYYTFTFIGSFPEIEFNKITIILMNNDTRPLSASDTIKLLDNIEGVVKYYHDKYNEST